MGFREPPSDCENTASLVQLSHSDRSAPSFLPQMVLGHHGFLRCSFELTRSTAKRGAWSMRNVCRWKTKKRVESVF